MQESITTTEGRPWGPNTLRGQTRRLSGQQSRSSRVRGDAGAGSLRRQECRASGVETSAAALRPPGSSQAHNVELFTVFTYV